MLEEINDLKAARALGWASLAIAATEILSHGVVEEEMLGIDEHRSLLQALGAREAAAGITILSQNQITPTLAAGLWSRVAGDVMDLALMAAAAPKSRNRAGFATAVAAVLGITAADIFYAFKIQRRLLMAKLDTRHAATLASGRSPAARPPIGDELAVETARELRPSPDAIAPSSL